MSTDFEDTKGKTMPQVVAEMASGGLEGDTWALTPTEASDACDKLADLLYFFLQVGKMISHLRNRSIDGMMSDDPEQFRTLLAMLDEAVNPHRHEQTDAVISFVETLGTMFFRETEEYKEFYHAD